MNGLPQKTMLRDTIRLDGSVDLQVAKTMSTLGYTTLQLRRFIN